MKKIILLLILISILLYYFYPFGQDNVILSNDNVVENRFLEPDEALQKLKDGNERYSNHNHSDHQFRVTGRKLAIQGQSPSVFILSCMDSRSIPEIVFDHNTGSLFVGRVAGNVIDKMMLASMEYAAHVGTKLFVIMGHTRCGAIEASCHKNGFGNINDLIAKIAPAVDAQENLDCSNTDIMHSITQENVSNSITAIKRNSKFLKEKLDNGDIAIVGAIHDIKTGKVKFLQNRK